MPTQVDIQEIQAEIEDRRSHIERQAEERVPQADITRLVRETNIRDAWKAARLKAE